MLLKTNLFSLVLFLLVLGTFRASGQSLPVYEVVRVQGSINIDGKLNEKAWANAQPVGAFVNNRDGSSSGLETDARSLRPAFYLLRVPRS